ncbi:MAG: hypothetical protein FWB80_07540 [Defluviitaleaceae bacterium]|nr:hypothetical protein [Defluviitaleaceae bacterium]
MQAVKGYVENGQFFPLGTVMQLPGRIKAVLTVLDEPAEVGKTENELDFWRRIDSLVDEATSEKLPDFPRLNFGRELVAFSEDE